MGKVYWAVGKMRGLEQNVAQWSKLINSLRSYIWTSKFNFKNAFHKYCISVFTIS